MNQRPLVVFSRFRPFKAFKTRRIAQPLKSTSPSLSMSFMFSE